MGRRAKPAKGKVEAKRHSRSPDQPRLTVRQGHCRTIHVENIEPLLETEYRSIKEASMTAGTGTRLATPLMREGVPIGVLVIRRSMVQPFTNKQIALLEMFADQAVIAIENVRLFKELEARNAEVTEALERQTATAEILRVINGSPTDLQPVFDTIVRNAVRLCSAAFGGLHRLDGARITLDAQFGMQADEFAFLQREVFPLPLSRGSVTGRSSTAGTSGSRARWARGRRSPSPCPGGLILLDRFRRR